MKMIEQGSSVLGEFFLLSVDKNIFSREAIMKTCYEFTDDYYIHVVTLQENFVGIYFYNKKDNFDEIKTDVKKFLQTLNDNQMKQIIYNETSVLHEVIIKKAFAPATTLIDKKNESLNNIPVLIE